MKIEIKFSGQKQWEPWRASPSFASVDELLSTSPGVFKVVLHCANCKMRFTRDD